MNILIVGDWVVDDYWVIAKHRSSTSSRTGIMHHRAVHDKQSSIRAFCGAGVTATILRKAYKNNADYFNIKGLGLWADGDDDSLRCMFDDTNIKGHNPYRIYHPPADSMPESVNLINLYAYIKSEEDRKNVGTSRVIRTYLQEGKKVTQLQRIDWELPLKNNESDFYNTDVLKEYLNSIDIDAIIIKDLGRGVITDKLITVLSQVCKEKINKTKTDKEIPWFVSSKRWCPEWLLKNINLKLLIIPQVAAQSAIDKDIVNSWITNSKYASQKALNALEGLYAKCGKKDTIFVVLPDKIHALAVHFKKNNIDDVDHDFMVIKDNIDNLGLDTNMASVYLGAATGLYLKELNTSDTISEKSFKKIFISALNYTHDWQAHEIKRISHHEEWNPSGSPKGYLDEENNIYEPKPESPEYNNEYKIKSFAHAKKEWEQSIARLGIVIDKDDKEKFELWRGMVDVDGYVCIADLKQKNITRLVHAINEYSKNFNKSGVRGGRARVPQSSCMLVASPGAGKTSLVRQLAENNNLIFMPFNITEMNRTTDIIDCFDNIMTTSLLDPTKPLMIFIDEINSELEGENIYKMFLSPLEDGKYNRGGKSFRLPSCFWVFASTESGDAIRSKMKGSDFVSRLTAGTISLDIQNTSDKRMENIYMAVSIMVSIFPDVNKISKEVLQIFADKLNNARIRELRHFIEKFVDVQYGTVSVKNIPNEFSDNISINDEDRKNAAQDELKRFKAIKDAREAKNEIDNLNNQKNDAHNDNEQNKERLEKLICEIEDHKNELYNVRNTGNQQDTKVIEQHEKKLNDLKQDKKEVEDRMINNQEMTRKIDEKIKELAVKLIDEQSNFLINDGWVPIIRSADK